MPSHYGPADRFAIKRVTLIISKFIGGPNHLFRNSGRGTFADVILPPARAQEKGLTSTVTFPVGNLAPEGSVIKSTAIDPTVVERRCRVKVSGVVTPSPVGVAMLKLRYPSPPTPRQAMLGPF